MSVFADQAAFMAAVGQTVGARNDEQFNLYRELVWEEVNEFFDACDRDDPVKIFDALLDVVVVCVGAGHSLGLPMEAGWAEVHASNMRKVDPATGQVRRRYDGKILKPEGWAPPNLGRLLGAA